MRSIRTVLLMFVVIALGACSSGSSTGSSDRVAGTTQSNDGGNSSIQPQNDPQPQNETLPDPDPQTDPDPASGAPTLSLNSSSNEVENGGSVTLSWSSQNADSCTASGGWSGSQSANGQVTISNLTDNQTFGLNCSGPEGSALAMVSVNVLGSLSLSWQAPTENVDGSPIDGLSAYRIHVGTSPGSYEDIVEVSGNIETHSLSLVKGEYYLAMTAVDLDGDESALSNEVSKRSI